MRTYFLQGTSVALRPVVQEDLTPAYREWFNDPDVCRYNSHHRFPNHDENMHAYFEAMLKDRKNLILGIFDVHTDEHIGTISLQNIENVDRSAEFAVLIGNRAYWGKGVGKEASRLIIEHGFKALNLHRIYCGTSADNAAMRKLASALGFKEEGCSREALFKDGVFKDVIQFGLLQHESR